MFTWLYLLNGKLLATIVVAVKNSYVNIDCQRILQIFALSAAKWKMKIQKLYLRTQEDL